jgi:hypothetical protein
VKGISILVVSLTLLAIAACLAKTPKSNVFSGDQALNGAFMDGAYLGLLAARRGNEPHVAIGRWSNEADRKAFSDGYMAAYNETTAKIVAASIAGTSIARTSSARTIIARTIIAKPSTTNDNQCAHRDGEYLGKLDAQQGRAEHIASGRWSQDEDRMAFASGYRDAYSETMARLERTRETAQAKLVR